MFLSFSSFDGILNKNKSFDLLQNAVLGRINNREGLKEVRIWGKLV